MKRILFFLLSLALFGVGLQIYWINEDESREQSGVVMAKSIDFSALKMEYSGLPEIRIFSPRDQNKLEYRFYDSESENILILLHGSGWHGEYFHLMAQSIIQAGIAKVYIPNLRGHGISPQKRGDVNYIGQLEDDLVDFLAFTKKQNPHAEKVVLGGHSSGGGLALLFGGGKYGKEVDGYLFLAPYIKHDAPTTRQDATWAMPKTMRIIGLSILNKLGVHQFDHLTTINFNLPQEFRNGTETLSYSHAMICSFSPVDYEATLVNITQPMLVLAGTEDEVIIAQEYENIIPRRSGSKVQILPNVDHIGIVLKREAQASVIRWLKEIFGS